MYHCTGDTDVLLCVAYYKGNNRKQHAICNGRWDVPPPLRRAGGTSDSLQLRTHLFETVVVGVPGDDRDAEEAGHLKEVLRRRRRPAELLGVAEVDDGGAAVEQVLAQRVRNSCVRTKTESSTELQILSLSSTSILDF